jgi:hypothetical protein
MVATIQTIIKSGTRQIVRRLYMKRYSAGAFESSWLDITSYVISFGIISDGFGDESYLGEFSIPSWEIYLSNRTRKFEVETDNHSFFYGYTSRDKTKFKITVSYIDNTETSGLNNDYTEVLARSFYGILLGDIQNDDTGTIKISLTSLLTVFKWFPFEGDAGTSALTSAIIDRSVKRTKSSIRIFDQWFEGINDAAKYQITTGIITLNPYITDKSKNIIDKIWSYALIEDYFAWINTDGNFVWKPRTATVSTQWIFNGGGSVDNDYGCNIITLNSDKSGKNNLFNRVVIGYALDTSGSLEYISADTAWVPGDGGSVDKYGLLSLDITIMDLNVTTGTAAASAILARYNTIKREIEITTPLIPQLVPADKVEVNYIGEVSQGNIFTLGLSLLGGPDLLGERLGSVNIDGMIGKIINATHDLDNLTSKFIIREV